MANPFANIAKRVVGIILIISACLSIYNIGFNGHYHKLDDGSVIYHYHPYSDMEKANKSPFKHHTHSEVELFLVMMQNICITILPALIILLIALLAQKKLMVYVPNIIKSYTSFVHTCSSLRAPPIFS